MFGAAGCHSTKPTSTASDVAETSSSKPPLTYSFVSLDERPVNSETLKGRVTVVSFVATFGDASLVQLRFLQKIASESKPPVNVVAVFLDPPENKPLVRMTRDSLRLSFLTGVADPGTVAGKGVFGDVGLAPTTVVLDGGGAEAWRRSGVVEPSELWKAIREARSRLAW